MLTFMCSINSTLLFMKGTASMSFVFFAFFLALILETDSQFEFHLGFPNNQRATMLRASVGHRVLVVFA